MVIKNNRGNIATQTKNVMPPKREAPAKPVAKQPAKRTAPSPVPPPNTNKPGPKKPPVPPPGRVYSSGGGNKTPKAPTQTGEYVGLTSVESMITSIDHRREELGLSIPAFCKAAEIDKSNYYKLTKGTSAGITVATLLRICTVLNMRLQLALFENVE